MNHERTLGSLFAGIGGFDLGFEQAGWRTVWQIERDDLNRAVLADRFPAAQQFRDVRKWRSYPLSPVACICAGFPCQDISVMGNAKQDRSRHGLAGGRSGLFWTVLEIVDRLQPQWLAIENVPALIGCNGGADLHAIVRALAQRNYLGHARVLDARYFGVPQQRRRLYLVAGLGRKPALDFLADAGPMESIPASAGSRWIAKPADAWAGYTLTAPNKLGGQNSRLSLGSELLVAEEDGWDQMVDRARATEIHGVRRGLDAAHAAEAWAAGNAVVPAIARWIAEIVTRS